MAKTIKWDKYKWIIRIMYLLAPLVVLAFLCLLTKKNLFLSVPTWSDELDYWREIYSFSENGFSFGGSLFAGYDATIGPFGGHSFSPVMVWGLVSIILPWNSHSIFVFNLVLLCVSWALFPVLGKFSPKENLFGILLAFCYPPIALYLFTSMIEIPLYALIIIYFALLSRFFKERDNKIFVWLMVIGAFIVLIRMTYIVILFPAIWAKTDFKFNLKTLRNMIIYVVGFLIVYKIFNLFCAGYPDWVTETIKKAPGIVGKLKVVLSNTKTNLLLYFNLFRESKSQVILRYAYGFLIVILLFFSFAKKEAGKGFCKTFDREFFSYAIMAGGLFAMMVTLYDIKDWRDYRTFAPIALMCFMFLFMRVGRDENDKLVKYCGIFVLLLMVIFSKWTLLTDDRNILERVEKISGFEELNVEKADGSSATIAATFDINWGDITLMESIPSQLGFQVFYKDEINEYTLKRVDYILTTDSFVETHEEIFEDMVYITDIKDYGVVYKVR